MFMPLESARQRKGIGDTRKNGTGYLTDRYFVRKSPSYEEAGKLRNGHAQTFEDTRINYKGVSAMPVVQMCVKMERNYNGDEIEWDDDQEKEQFWNTVDRGLELAQEKLKKVKEIKGFLGTYATFVLAILSCSDLEIYPMIDDRTGIYGQSAFAQVQISLEVNRHKGNPRETAKTLIHEGFHIYGGCWKINDAPDRSPGDPHLVYDQQLDTECNSNAMDEIYGELAGRDKLRVRADAFAQFVMLYG